jgi:hypothetical protein
VALAREPWVGALPPTGSRARATGEASRGVRAHDQARLARRPCSPVRPSYPSAPAGRPAIVARARPSSTAARRGRPRESADRSWGAHECVRGERGEAAARVATVRLLRRRSDEQRPSPRGSVGAVPAVRARQTTPPSVLVREGGAHRLRNVLPFDDRAEQQVHAKQVEQPAAGRLTRPVWRVAHSGAAAPPPPGGCAVAAAATASGCNGERRSASRACRPRELEGHTLLRLLSKLIP